MSRVDLCIHCGYPVVNLNPNCLPPRHTTKRAFEIKTGVRPADTAPVDEFKAADEERPSQTPDPVPGVALEDLMALLLKNTGMTEKDVRDNKDIRRPVVTARRHFAYIAVHILGHKRTDILAYLGVSNAWFSQVLGKKTKVIESDGLLNLRIGAVRALFA